jgi:D-alanyl-D-alanine carboxypeptidase
MTVYVAFRAVEAGQATLKSPVVVSERAAGQPPSKMGYPAGSVMTLDNALKMLAVKSANDIALAVAESLAGSQAAFADRMNREARRLGMTGTHFINPHGLHDPAQYSTARDMAILAAALRREFPEHAGYFNLEGIRAGDRLMRNYNILLGRFEGADGMKTGFVCASGFNLVGSATRGGRTLIAVVLGARSQEERGETAARLLAEGFERGRTSGARLDSLAPYGDGRDRPIDMRSAICSKQAQAERWDERDSEGRMIVRSRFLKPMNRDPRTVAVGLGGATGPAPEIWLNVPIPTPRPDPEGAQRDGSAGERPETLGGIPLPTPRESSMQ